MSRFSVLFGSALAFAMLSTMVAGSQFLVSANSKAGAVGPGLSSSVGSLSSAVSSISSQISVALPPLNYLIDTFVIHSFAIAPTSWFLVAGLWIWRGRMKSRWIRWGFDSEIFRLFVKMRGGRTRIRLLNSLFEPKDRLQLAQSLGIDWKAIDRHVQVLSKYGFVRERVAYGKVKFYELTSQGKTLLHLLDELTSAEQVSEPVAAVVAPVASPVLR